MFSNRQFDQAEQCTRQQIRTQPTFVDPEKGSAWFLLCRILIETKGPEAALDTAALGIETLKSHNRFDIFLADEFVKLAIQLQKTEYYERVTESFYEILENARLPGDGQILTRLYEQCQFLLSPSQQKEYESLAASSHAPGRALRKFWRSKDATPVTPLNERLIEHLQRVEHALKFYPNSLPRGFDDRGLIYVKLGKPSGVASAGVSGRDIRSNYTFKPNEVWLYNFIDPQLYFPFVHLQDKRGYVLVEGIEQAITGALAASKWRSHAPRVGVITDSLGRSISPGLISDTPEIDTRIYFYKQLAIVSPVFHQRVNELETLLLQKQYEQIPLPASYYTQIAVNQMTTSDFRDDSFRDQITPTEVSSILGAEALPLRYRTARFLESDGSTRVEIYLGLRRRDLVLKENIQPNVLMLKMSATVEDATLRPAANPQTSIVLPGLFTQNDSSNSNLGVLVEVLTIKTHLDSFYVSGEVGGWLTSVSMQPPAPADTGAAEPGLYLNSEKLLRLASFRSSQQTALRLEARQQPLLMSDVQLSRQIEPNADSQTTTKSGLTIEPYPFQRVERQRPLFLYFEIYGLTLGEDNASSYRISYEAEQISEKQNIWKKVKSLLGKKPGGQIELQSDYRGDSSNINEWISLDLSALAPGAVKINVTITDLHTGGTAKRAIEFELI